MPFLADEPLAVHEDPADRKRRQPASKATADIHRSVGEMIAIRYSREDWARRAQEARAKGAGDIIRNASPGRNAVSAEAFDAVLELSFPAADYPRERRQANRAGRIEWGGGVVFERVTE